MDTPRSADVRFAYHTISWAGLETALPAIAAAGYDGFEAFSAAAAIDETAFRDLCQAHGLKLAAVYHGVGRLDPSAVPDERAVVRNLAAWLRRQGADRLVLGGGDVRPGGNLLEDYRRLGDALTLMGRDCQEEGVLACYHPHWGTAVEDGRQIDLLMELADVRYLLLAPDTAHLAVGGCDPVAIIRTYASRIRYVHLKDVAMEGLAKVRPGSAMREEPYPYFRALGQGGVDLPGILDALREVGYTGWLTTELDRSDDPARRARDSRSYLQGACRA